ncbi:hypothetical protein [Streptomyces sp. bgisy060]|uniref:hypothetical protein n=1 Tax=Streptomyces sp. bgisy060 TaxID=3413775 RepID=UPI003EB8D536
MTRRAAVLELAPAGLPSGTGPLGGDLIFPWQAGADDWISVPEGPAADNRYHAGSSHADAYIEDGIRVERLDAEAERARAQERWNEDHCAWHSR